MNPALQLVQEVHHAYVKFSDGTTVVAVDPFGVKNAAHDADLIVVTHQHGDHYAPEDIEKLMKEDTLFFTTAQVAPLLRERFSLAADRVLPFGEAARFIGENDLSITGIHAENRNHPPEGTFGVLLALGGFTYYLSGDTDLLDKHIACDVLFCCCDGVYNMLDYLNQIPAQLAAMETTPGLVVPYHYENAAQRGNGERLAQKLRGLGYETALL